MAGNKGINTSGQHSVESYQLGRGILYAAELDTNGYPKNFEDLGNVPELTAAVESEKLDHFSSRQGLRKIDKSVILQVTSSISFALEDINFNNLAKFFSGEASSYTNPAIAGVTDERFVNDGDVAINTWYILRTAAGNPIFGITATNAIIVESTNVTPIALTEGVDYTLNATEGQIFLNDTTAVGNIITAGDGLQVTLTADGSATTVDQVTVLSETELNLALRFVLEDADTGEKVIYDYHSVTLSADGDYSLISEEFAQLPMTASVEESDAYDNVADIFYPKTQA